MKNVITIIRKEFARFFKDRRMIVTVLLPGLLIFALYSLMGSAMSDIYGVDENYKPTACVVNAPFDLSEALTPVEMDVEQAKERVADGELDILVIFPENFTLEFSEEPSNVVIFYNSAQENSLFGYALMGAMLDSINKSVFTVNAGGDYDLADDTSTAVKLMTTLVPMLMFSLLASGCVALAPEAIAGEKERGTMATMLITPVNRVEIALGKIISLSCFALLSGISSFLGVIFSLPKLADGAFNISAIPYGAGDYFMLFGIIISVVLVIISAFSVVSAYAKNVKEAGALITPLMIVVILLGLASMILSKNTSVWLHLVPLLGSALAVSGIMSLMASPLGVVLSIVSNLAVTALLIVLLTFMFKSEKIMFKK